MGKNPFPCIRATLEFSAHYSLMNILQNTIKGREQGLSAKNKRTTKVIYRRVSQYFMLNIKANFFSPTNSWMKHNPSRLPHLLYLCASWRMDSRVDRFLAKSHNMYSFTKQIMRMTLTFTLVPLSTKSMQY